MKTLLVTSPQGKIEHEAVRELAPDRLAGWHIEALPSSSFARTATPPAVTVVQVGDQTRPAQLRAMIPGLARLQNGLPQGSFVLFALKCQAPLALRKAKAQQRRLQAIVDQISLSLPEFPNPERVDVVEYASGLATKLSLIEAKLRFAPPRPSPLDKVKEVIMASSDLRTVKGKLSATAVASAFGLSLSQLASGLGRTRQALSKTPDAGSLQDQLGFFERVARLRTVLPKAAFLKWLRMPNTELDEKRPLELLASGERQVVADLVDDMLTGAPA